MSDPIVGIDLGTTNTAVAVCDEVGAPRVLADPAGFKVQPSVVSFHPNGSIIIGAEAKQRKIIDPKNTVYSAKRLIGRSYRSKEVGLLATRLPFAIKEGDNEQPLVAVRSGEFAIPEISALVLDHVRKIAEKALGTSVTRAVVTVPANFTDAQRSATATAGSIAGITVVRVLNEPTAAALAYGHTKQLNQRIAVYDFGGGTFDVTILRLTDQVYEVLGTAGDSMLGGDDLDERLVDHMVDLFLKRHRLNLRENITSLMRLRSVAEQIKIELSRRSRALVKIDELAHGPGGKPLAFELEITRDEFVNKASDIIERTFPVCEEALKLAGCSPRDIDDVILVGGSTRIPLVRERVSKFFGRPPRTDINPEEAVALGAALQAMAMERMLSRPVTKNPPGAGELPAYGEEELTTGVTHQGGAQTAVAAEKARIAAAAAQGKTAVGVASSDIPDLLAPVSRATGDKGDKKERRTVIGVPAMIPPVNTAPQGAPILIPPAPPTKPPMPAPPPSIKPPAPATTRPAPPPMPAAGPGPRPVDPGVAPLAQALDLDLPSSAEPLELDGPNAATQLAELDLSTLGTLPGPAGMMAPGMMPPPRGRPASIPLASSDEATEVRRPPVEAPRPVAPLPRVVDVVSRGLGISTVAGFCEALIRRNTRIPAEIKRVFTTSRDKQQVVKIQVCQGESRRMAENQVLGDVTLTELEPRSRGETSIEVTFSIDGSGILQVRARDLKSGREQRANLSIVGAQSAEEVSLASSRVKTMPR